MFRRHKGKKSKDTCSCWACRDKKYRESRISEKRDDLKKAFDDWKFSFGSVIK